MPPQERTRFSERSIPMKREFLFFVPLSVTQSWLKDAIPVAPGAHCQDAPRVLASKRIMAAVVSSPNDSAHRLA
jgi:hypothetical protein